MQLVGEKSKFEPDDADSEPQEDVVEFLEKLPREQMAAELWRVVRVLSLPRARFHDAFLLQIIAQRRMIEEMSAHDSDESCTAM